MLVKTNLLFQDLHAASAAKGTFMRTVLLSFLSIPFLICNRYPVCIHVLPRLSPAAAPLYFPSDCKPVNLESTLFSGSEAFVSSAPVPPSAPRLHTPTFPATPYNHADAARKAREREETLAGAATSPAAPSLSRPPHASPRLLHVTASRDTPLLYAAAAAPPASSHSAHVVSQSAAAGEEVRHTLTRNCATLQRCAGFICCSGWLQHQFSRRISISA